jgi:hypothetical protein
VAWVEAPWLPAQAELATSPMVGLSAWYTGEATVVAGAERRPVDLAPLVWSPAGKHGEATRVTLP